MILFCVWLILSILFGVLFFVTYDEVAKGVCAIFFILTHVVCAMIQWGPLEPVRGLIPAGTWAQVRATKEWVCIIDSFGRSSPPDRLLRCRVNNKNGYAEISFTVAELYIGELEPIEFTPPLEK